MTNASVSHEQELGYVRDGYPALADWIGRDPDAETFVFRKFSRLSARNLLHLQNKLFQLEHEIDQLDEEARRNTTDIDAGRASRRWETLKELAADPTRPERQRWEKAEELTEMIQKYSPQDEALLQQAQVAEIGRPSNRVIAAYNDYLRGRSLKGSNDSPSFPMISGRAKDVLNDRDDLVSPCKALNQDHLTKLLQDHWVFQKRKSRDPLDRTTVYRAEHVAWTAAAISFLSAVVLLVVAIVSLYVVESANAKLALVTVYTVLFAVSVALLTNSKRAEVYGAAAAYAAVLVVFISGNLGSTPAPLCMVQLSNGVYKSIPCST